jgi:hypothetical protein
VIPLCPCSAPDGRRDGSGPRSGEKSLAVLDEHSQADGGSRENSGKARGAPRAMVMR